MDAGHELGRAKWLLLAGVLFLASGCISWNEMVYLVAGRTADAQIVKASEVTKKTWLGMTTQQYLEFDYTFTEPDGTRRTGTDTAALDWPVPATLKTPVQYTAGANGNSRLAGHANWIGLGIFAASLLAVGWFAFRFVREAKEALKDNPKRGKW